MNADMIPDAELAEIEKRNRERTQGEWFVSDTSIVCGEDTCIAVIEDDGGYQAPPEERKANADLIANAPNDITRLLAMVRAMGAELAELKKAKMPADVSGAVEILIAEHAYCTENGFTSWNNPVMQAALTLARRVPDLVQELADLHRSVADATDYGSEGWRQAAMLSDEIERLKNPLSVEAVERLDKHAERIAETLEQSKEPR